MMENDKAETGALPGRVTLREVIETDLDVFFENQRDPQANRMAAFTAKDPSDREAFDRQWARILADDEVIIRTILYNGQVAGSVLSYIQSDEREVSYWLGREYWGKGIATQSLAQYLDQVKARPLYARVAKDNLASLRVLEKCGFKITGEDRGFANARGEEVEEYFLTLAEANDDR
jgi:RimJ/RimL family protein N-acetyltransferase